MIMKILVIEEAMMLLNVLLQQLGDERRRRGRRAGEVHYAGLERLLQEGVHYEL